MEGSRLSPYPHLSWFAYGLAIRPPRVFFLHEYTAVSHRLIVTEDGDADFSWAAGAAHVTSHVTGGSIGFFPHDSAEHSLGITTTEGYSGHELLLPTKHLVRVCEAEGARHVDDLRVIPVFRDTYLSACLLRLLVGHASGHISEDVGAEIAARQAIVRLAAIAGGRPPEWLRDTSVFPPPVMARIAERVDARLMFRPSLDDLSSGFGLSPSHFARKFQQSTGVSLSRFVNRRRIRLSLELLKNGRESLAQLSLDLGFYSQSHFTRVFNGLTGLTPHQFRRSQRLLGV